MKYNHDLVLMGANNKQVESIIKENKELLRVIRNHIPYDISTQVDKLTKNFDRLIQNYCKYAYLLGFTHAQYEE